MGIRVHKSLGYGAKDVSLNGDSLMKENMTIRDFVKWAKRNKKGILDFYLRNSPGIRYGSPEEAWEFSLDLISKELLEKTFLPDHLISDDEYGIMGVVQFIPVGCHDWARYDDIIDYCEEESSEPRVEFLDKCGIYPWLGMVRYRDCPPGIWKNKEAEDRNAILAPSQWGMLTGNWDKVQGPLVDERALKHLTEDYRPILPMELAAVVYFFREAFDDVDKLYNSLRPMIYVYWA